MRWAIEVASGVGSTPSFVNRSSAATDSTGFEPIASRSDRAVSTARSAFVATTTKSASRAASSFVAPSTPTNGCGARARSASREPITTS